MHQLVKMLDSVNQASHARNYVLLGFEAQAECLQFATATGGSESDGPVGGRFIQGAPLNNQFLG